jgi:hypothetical protein
MKSKVQARLAMVFAVSLTIAMGAQQGTKPITISPCSISGPATANTDVADRASDSHAQSPLALIGVLRVPAPIASTDLLWVDQPTGRLFLADRTNKSIDIWDASHGNFIGQVTGLIGVTNVAAGITSQGPNGLLVTPDNKLWIGDGMAITRVADLNLNPPAIIKSITVGPAADGRADELAYDPVEHLIMVGFDAARPPYLAVISADTYEVLGKIQFPDAEGMEQPWWDTQLHRFLVNVPGGNIAVVDPVKMKVTKQFKIPNCNAGTNGLVVGPFQRMFVYGCGRALIMNAIDGHVIADNLTQIGTGGDELWFNAGDGRYYVTAIDTTTRIQSMHAVDAETSTWVESVPAVGIRNVAAYEGNNHIFSAVRAPAAGVADTTVCTSFGFVGTGCIAVFAHSGGQ